MPGPLPGVMFRRLVRRLQASGATDRSKASHSVIFNLEHCEEAGCNSNLGPLPDHYSRIFLLSHMRAFTSLAGHILGSHPQINGYYEMHISYDDARALDKQLEVYLEHDALKAGSRYLFDKLLHNEYRLETGKLDITGTKILLALREPEQTISSIVNLFAKKETDELYASPVEAATYYIDRVTALAGHCRTADQGYYYFDAEMLPRAPGSMLPELSRWLELDFPLSDRYATFSQTGKDRRGDSSALIHSGGISQAKREYPDVCIPEALLETAQRTYRDCRREMIDGAAGSVTL